ncbi:hypothetical protein AAC387_Pa01g3782 [Persea americana]
MEEIRRAGQGHYDNMSSLEKEMVKQMFASHAANGEGRISRQDVFIQFANSMPTSNIASFFSMIDKDNNGFLDFSEFVTLHYVTHSRPPCNCCKKIVNGLYFCCERCWEMHVRSRVEFQPYELCSECYYGKRFIHEHHEFLDNFMLLRSEANRHSRKKEKVLEAGRFHFKFLTEPELNVARKLFGEMDQDEDCRVHSNEVIDFLISKGMPSTEAQKIFDNMGLMQNSYLTFEDLVAFWYVLVNRPVCDGCRDIIMGSYYTCDACFYAYNDGGDTNTYDLCHGCYSKNGKHDAHREHGIFVDNTALLLHLKDQKARPCQLRKKSSPETERSSLFLFFAGNFSLSRIGP